MAESGRSILSENEESVFVFFYNADKVECKTVVLKDNFSSICIKQKDIKTSNDPLDIDFEKLNMMRSAMQGTAGVKALALYVLPNVNQEICDHLRLCENSPKKLEAILKDGTAIIPINTEHNSDAISKVFSYDGVLCSVFHKDISTHYDDGLLNLHKEFCSNVLDSRKLMTVVVQTNSDQILFSATVPAGKLHRVPLMSEQPSYVDYTQRIIKYFGAGNSVPRDTTMNKCLSRDKGRVQERSSKLAKFFTSAKTRFLTSTKKIANCAVDCLKVGTVAEPNTSVTLGQCSGVDAAKVGAESNTSVTLGQCSGVDAAKVGAESNKEEPMMLLELDEVSTLELDEVNIVNMARRFAQLGTNEQMVDPLGQLQIIVIVEEAGRTA